MDKPNNSKPVQGIITNGFSSLDHINTARTTIVIPRAVIRMNIPKNKNSDDFTGIKEGLNIIKQKAIPKTKAININISGILFSRKVKKKFMISPASRISGSFSSQFIKTYWRQTVI